MRKILLALLSTAMIVALVACQKTEESSSAADAPATEAASVAAMDAAAPARNGMMSAELAKTAGVDALDQPPQPPVTVEQLTSSATSYVDKERKFVRTADAQFRVKDVYQSAIAIENIVANQGGFVVTNQIKADTENVNRYRIGNEKLLELAQYTMRGQLSVRVPSDKTQDFLRALIAQIDFLDQRNFEARDVQFDLLRKQLEFLRSQEAQKQLGDLSTTPGKISDKAAVIAGQNDAKANRDEAAVVQKEVEDKIAFSTINLSLYQLSKVRKTEIDDVDAIAKSSRPGFFNRLASAIVDGWYGLLDIAVDLSAIWPLWLAIGLGIFAIKRYRKK